MKKGMSGKKVSPPAECPDVAEATTLVKEETPLIPNDLLKSFIGRVDGLLKIDQHRVNHGKYRVNVWTQSWPEGAYCPTNRIAKAYFLVYEDGKISDKTR